MLTKRDLFPEALRLIAEIRLPRGTAGESSAASQRGEVRRVSGTQVLERLSELGFRTWWQLVNASDHGVPQLRPRFVLVAIAQPWAAGFRWPDPLPGPAPTVGATLADLMGSAGWAGAADWAARADRIAPTIVGGSKKHGGPDLGPTRARAAWRELGVDGLGIADNPPGPDFPPDQAPKLTVRMVARLQGFPDSWQFSGRKTAAYRQVGNAFPPPMCQRSARADRGSGADRQRRLTNIEKSSGQPVDTLRVALASWPARAEPSLMWSPKLQGVSFHA